MPDVIETCPSCHRVNYLLGNDDGMKRFDDDKRCGRLRTELKNNHKHGAYNLWSISKVNHGVKYLEGHTNG